jgi:hypothetical protein
MFFNPPAFVSELAYAKKYSEILEEAFFNDKDQFSSTIYWYCFKVKIAVSEDMKRPLKGLQNW